jgi:hypothetical protein
MPTIRLHIKHTAFLYIQHIFGSHFPQPQIPHRQPHSEIYRFLVMFVKCNKEDIAAL